MKKQEFSERLAMKGYTKTDAKQITNDVITTIMECLVDGESVLFHGFGTFKVSEVAARETVDMQTKERIVIPAHEAPKFVPGKELKRAIKEGVVRR